MPRARTLHGVSVGILLLDTGFQRVPGDIGHAATWPFPVQYAVVKGATGARVAGPEAGGTLDLFARAAADLAAMGVDGIVTSCGFLAVLQRELAARCPVPVATSSLLQIPMAQALLPPGRTVGVLTPVAEALTSAHFQGVGVAGTPPVEGLPPDSLFKRDLLENRTAFDVAAHQREVVAAARRLVGRHPEVGAIVSECANFPVHSAAVAAELGLPVFDTHTLVSWFHAGLRPRHFTAGPSTAP
ncbi:aspartate/glutamate racemase family protein [Pigmentiphaga kullae]|uniref:Aspartate/glutamate racemase family protein n=1 Tax=Pigmentiphaga kullae TaxID=151784 RepID=A0A4Q7NKA2_9BURK|nr:aspartate/glutamate racemase family protein [Pigmentiphaga kullae]RZS85433.1 hypothetical protein EV675_1457 [Pigmentiphaga kullae]